MATVETATGQIESGQLGFTLMHEHVVVRSPGVAENFPHIWNREQELEKAVRTLGEARARGVDTIIDATTVDLGRDIEFVTDVARRSAMQIVLATGVWIDPPRYFNGRSIDDVAALFIRDIEEGIAGSGVKAGVVKCGADMAGVTPEIEKALRAAARAHRATGVPITTHTAVSLELGRAQQDIFESEGVDLSRVIIGHSGDSTNVEYLLGLLERGSYIGMDRFGINALLPTAERVAIIARLCEMGYAGKMVLSHDTNCYMEWIDPAVRALMPDWRFTYISDRVIPALVEAGVSEEQVRQMTVDNPRLIFERRDPY